MSEEKFRQFYKIFILDGKNDKKLAEVESFGDTEQEALIMVGAEIKAAVDEGGIKLKEASIVMQHLGQAKVPPEKKE